MADTSTPAETVKAQPRAAATFAKQATRAQASALATEGTYPQLDKAL